MGADWKTIVILSAFSLVLLIVGVTIMLFLPMATSKIDQTIQQFVTDKEFMHDVYGQYIRLRSAYPPTDTFPNPLGIGFIAAGVVLFLITLAYYGKES